MVILTNPILGDREFTEEHAKKLLARVNTGGWTLVDAKKSENDGSGNSGNKGNTKKSTEQKQDSEGDKPRK